MKTYLNGGVPLYFLLLRWKHSLNLYTFINTMQCRCAVVFTYYKLNPHSEPLEFFLWQATIYKKGFEKHMEPTQGTFISVTLRPLHKNIFLHIIATSIH